MGRAALSFAPGATQQSAPPDDALDDLWRTYYAHIFNPARLKVQAMRSEMPVRYWRNLPEARVIKPLVREARQRTGQMIDADPSPSPPKAGKWTPLPRSPASTPYQHPAGSLKAELLACERCSLHRFATQAVPGEGVPEARLMLIVLVKKSVWDLATQAEMLDLMELGPEAVVVIHVGGAYGDRPTGVRRWVETWSTLPEHVRTRLVLEHDDLRFSAADVLWIHRHTGVRLVFDYQHFWCFNPERLDLLGTLRAILETWPDGVRPKIHFSTPRTELREISRKSRKTGRHEKVRLAPVWTGHADFCNPFEFLTFMRTAADLEFDVMLESKAKDLAVTRLRPDMLRYADDVASRFGLTPTQAQLLESEQAALLEQDPAADA